MAHRILIIDDDAGLRKTLSDILRAKGYETLMAKDGAEGLSALKQGPVNLMLIDLRLPDISGFEVLDRAKAAYPLMEAIVLTGYAALESAIEATNKGAFSYLKKPYEIDQLLVHIRRAIEKQQAEVILRKSEERFRKIFEEAPVGMIISGMDNRILKTNKAICEMLGYAGGELDGRDIDELACPEDMEKDAVMTRQLLEGKIAGFRMERRYIRKNGEILWANLTATEIHSEDGSTLYSLDMIEDITGRKRAEEERKRSEERFRTLVETTSDWVWEVDARGVYTYASPKVRDILGYEPEEVLGKTPFNLMPAGEAERVAEIFGHIADAKKPFSMLANTNLHRDGREVVIETSGVPVLDDEGNLLGYRGIDRDITERSVLYERLRHAAFNDALTDLPNRALFLERLKGSVERAKRHHDYLFAVLFLDLDRFKNVNDSLGHLHGDQLLLGVTERLKKCVRPYDTIARLGGDEFAVLLEDIKSGRDAIRIAERIQEDLTLPFKLEEHEVFATASIGIVLSRPGYGAPEELLRDADTAMYQAKASGRGCHVIFDEVMHARATAYLRMENDLRQAIEKKELILHYQPIVSVDEGRIAGFEALVRWRPAYGELVLPAEFIPLAEETGLIKPIGRWIFHEACRQMRAWHKRFPASPPLTVSINISSRQFTKELTGVVREALEESGLDPESLRIEITESVIMEKPSAAAALILQLRKMNVKVHLDDFGTGYSSLSYLHRFPIDALKIDRSFVNVMSTDEGAMEITKSVIALAHSLRKRVIAEGVETAGQLEELRRLRCDYYQGYLFSKPLDREAAESLLGGALQRA